MTNILKIEIIKLENAHDLILPKYATEFSAGVDLCAAINEPIVISPGGTELIPTGIKISLPKCYEAQIRPRSGLAIKHAITVLNSPGTIDSDYQGEIKVILINLGDESYTIKHGDRIAQMVVSQISRISWNIVSDFTTKTERSSNGFGSTGI